MFRSGCDKQTKKVGRRDWG